MKMKKYTNSFVAMHWIHAVLITFVLVGATLSLPDLPQDGSKLAPFKGHMIFGLVLTLLTFIRIYMAKKQPQLPALKMSAFRENIVFWNHRLIYLFLVLSGLSGAATAKSANVGQVVIFGNDPSVYTGPGGITETLATIHGASTTILIGLIVMHIVGVIAYALKGNPIMKRMWF